MATALSSTEILVTWDTVPFLEQNGVITSYQVFYQPLQISDGTSRTMTVTEKTAFLGGLEEYVEYNISVRAYTSVGAGPYSDGIVERTLEDGMECDYSVCALIYYAICHSSSQSSLQCHG